LSIIPDTIKRKKTNWIGHALRRNYLLKHIIKGHIDGKTRCGKRDKQLAEDVNEKKGY